MGMPAQQARAFGANRAVAKRRAFRRTGDDPDVLGHGSEDLEDFVGRPGRIATAGRHANDAIEEPVLLRRGLEIWCRTEIILTRVDLLALVELLDDPGRAVPHAPVAHVDQSA